MDFKKRMIAVFLAALTLLPGCSLTDTEQLYSLPQTSKEYLQLQKLIDSEIANGCEYAAPTAGSQRQSVQLTDLDGDGTNEAVAFLRNAELQPLVCVYAKRGGEYALDARIVGDGSAIGRVEYADLDDDGENEIVVSWEAASNMQLMTAYTLSGGNTAELIKASCLDFQVGDMNGDGRADVLTLNLSESGGRVDCFSVSKRRDVTKRSAGLSASLKSADRFRIAAIADSVPAAFVEGPYSESDTGKLLTDIFVFSGDALKNITLDPATGSSRLQRGGSAYCTDIDGNGSLDVPVPENESRPRETPEDRVLDWYTFSADGSSALCAATFHCGTDGWFMTLPENWRGRLSVRRTSAVSGEHAVVLSLRDEGGTASDVLTVYTLTDENRADRAKLGERFVLMDSGTAVYAAEIDDASAFLAGSDAQQTVKDRFRLITADWITGAF